MATIERTSKNGHKITVEVKRWVSDETLWADGWNIPNGRKAHESTLITVVAASGKKTSGWGLTPLRLPMDKSVMDKGATARMGDSYVGAEMQALIEAALAEANAAEPGDEEFWALTHAAETAKAEAGRRMEAEQNDPEWQHYEAFRRRMEDPNSDL